MNRRRLLVSSFAIVAMFPLKAAATSPHPLFQNPRLIVLSLSFVSGNQDLRAEIDSEKLEASLVNHLAEELRGLEIRVVVGPSSVPAGMPSESVLFADVRVDAAILGMDGRQLTLSSISIVFRRGGSTFQLGDPFELLGSPKETWREQVLPACVSYIDRVLIDPIKLLNQRPWEPGCMRPS